MCGINIISHPDYQFAWSKMDQAIKHRGTSSRTVALFDGRLCISHRRLPIIGLEKEHNHLQEYQGYITCFVGEFLNYTDLDRKAESDYEMFRNLYPYSKERLFTHTDGFWAACAVDLTEQKLHIYTDCLAKKPVYVRMDDCEHIIGISSEIKPLTFLDENEADELYFSSVAKWGYHIGDRTPFKNIYKLPPYCHLSLNIKTREWSAELYDRLKPNPLLIPRLRELILTAVQNRRVSHQPISFLVSGGLDSTIIYKLGARPEDKVYHVDNNEDYYVDLLGIENLEKVSLGKITVEEALKMNQTPVDLGSVLPQAALSKAIDSVVVLSGDGADELFGGYRRAMDYDSQASDIFEELVYYHLPRLDRVMMANTIELRNPFLARNVIEAALAVPYHQRTCKQILKKIFADIVPRKIIERQKEPLKIQETRHIEEKLKWRRMLIEKFRNLEGI